LRSLLPVCGAEISMPQQFLHYPYIRTPFNQVSSKLVPQSVGVQVIKASGQRCERVTFCSVIITKFCELYNSSNCYLTPKLRRRAQQTIAIVFKWN
jgi:hypothetical protein